ncbi:iron chaperone [Candidatus Leptofilum sp.]|uniref:iron chaperone n=1 Tax=Candidatus Leptofilum sp. TaxID=3241576 RepID=UPI003B5C5AA1
MDKPATIDEYIANQPPEVKKILQKVREVVKTAVPNATETITYGMPTFKLDGNLVHFGASKNHLGFYPTPSGITAFADELTSYKSSKGAVQFPYNQPIPYELISKIAQFRAVENLEKAAAKSGKRSA